MLKIRLSRVGKNNTPIYRLVVAEKSRAVKREYIEIVGLFNPTSKDNKFQCKKERVEYWLSKGAQPSETVNNLLCDFGVLDKDKKIKRIHGKKTKKKDLNSEGENPKTDSAVTTEIESGDAQIETVETEEGKIPQEETETGSGASEEDQKS